MKRAENCVNCKVNHIYFRHDSLVFSFAKSKGHQKGEKHVGPWHVYSNPFKPWICPVLALARYIFSFPDVLKGDRPLFDGGSQYNRYTKIFDAILNELRDDLYVLGYESGDLGTHSSRKGVATYIASACTVSPPIAPLCIRAGWVLGGMKDKYINTEKAGDQYVGRCASMLDQLSKDFSVSCPYFDFSDKSYEEKVRMRVKVQKYVDDRLPINGIIKAQTWNLIVHCFASICYHYTHLSENLHQENMFRASAIFRDIPSDFLKASRIAFPWNKTEDTPSLTGIPPHVLNMAELEVVKKELIDLKETLPTKISTMLDNRGFSSTGLNTTKVIEAITNQYKSIVEEVMKKANLTITREIDDVNDVDFVIEDEEITTSYDDKPTLTETEVHLKSKQSRESADASIKKRRYTMGYCHGKLTALPADFAFPKGMTSQQLVLNWYAGSIKQNIPPYGALTGIDFSHNKSMRRRFCEMRIFMKYFECVARKHGAWIDNIRDRTPENVKNMWNRIGHKHIIQPFTKDGGRVHDICWKSVYNRLSLAKEFSKESTVYVKNPKTIVPVDLTTPPPSPPGQKDPEYAQASTSVARRSTRLLTTTQTTTTTTTPVDLTTPPPSPPGQKTTTQTTTKKIGRKRSAQSVLPTHPPKKPNVSITRDAAKDRETREKLDEYHKELERYENEHSDKIIKLKRNGAKMFEPASCGLCGHNSQHRCTYLVTFSKFLDVSTNGRICGKPLCNLCLGENSSKNRCAYHKQRDEYGDSD